MGRVSGFLSEATGGETGLTFFPILTGFVARGSVFLFETRGGERGLTFLPILTGLAIEIRPEYCLGRGSCFLSETMERGLTFLLILTGLPIVCGFLGRGEGFLSSTMAEGGLTALKTSCFTGCVVEVISYALSALATHFASSGRIDIKYLRRELSTCPRVTVVDLKSVFRI